jgi:hypothetical protein
MAKKDNKGTTSNKVTFGKKAVKESTKKAMVLTTKSPNRTEVKVDNQTRLLK